MSKCVTVQPVDVLHSSTKKAWMVCLSAGLFFFYVFFQLNAFDVINQSLRQDFNINAAQLSWMCSAFVWANVLFLLPAGVILDRMSVRTAVLGAMFLCVFGTFGFAFTHSFYWATFFHALSGVANAFCFLSCVLLVTRWFPQKRQAFVMGCIVTMGFMGGMVAHTPLAFLDHTYGWRMALGIDGLVGVVCWLWMVYAVHDKASARVHTPNVSWWSTMMCVLKVRENLLCGIYTGCLNLPIMILCALWGASYLLVVHHMDAMMASRMLSLIYVGSIFGAPLIGWLSDRYGARKPFMAWSTLGTLILFIPVVLGIDCPTWVLAGLFFFIGLLSSSQVLGYPIIAQVNAADQTGLATGVASVIVMGGGGVGQILFGSLMQHHAGLFVQQYNAHDFGYAMLIFPIAIMTALIVLPWIREK